MQKYRKEILDAIEDHEELTVVKVASMVGVSKSSIANIKSGGSIGFRTLLKLSHILFPLNYPEKMTEWCLQLDSTETIKQSFEYAAITREIVLLKNLIDKYSKETGTIKEYVKVYGIIHGYMIGTIEGFDLNKEIKKLGQIKDSALKVLLYIVRCYSLYFQKKFHLMLELAHEAEQDLSELSNKRELFIKECYVHRLAEILAPTYMHFNNMDVARHYAYTIINANVCAKTVSDGFYTVGMTYLVQDAEKCLSAFEMSYEIAKSVGDIAIETEAKYNLDLAKIYLNLKLDNDSDPLMIANQANNLKDWDSLKEVMIFRGEDDFILFFEAIETKSIEKLYVCFQKFYSQSNIFFSSLIAKHLYELGEDSYMTKIMINHKNYEGNVIFEENFISSFNSCSFIGSSVCA